MKKIIIYGDSIAASLYNGKPSNLLDQFILDELSDYNITNIEIDNKGVPGASTTSALKEIGKISSNNVDYIIFIIGVNDAINIKNNLKEYENNLKEIISKVHSKNIILLGPSYVDKNIKHQVDYKVLQNYNHIAELISERKNVHFINIYQCMVDYPDVKELLQKDGLHPSRLGYHYIAKKIIEVIVQQENRL